MSDDAMQGLAPYQTNTFLAMYHGVVTPGRGIERNIEAISLLSNNYKLIVLGNGNEKYISSLRFLCESLDVLDRVCFHPAVPRDALEAYVAAADVGLVTIEAVSKSYYYMLPNKFFENIQAETPVVASDFPETSKIIEEYGIGLTCDPSDSKQIAACIKRLCEDSNLYSSCKEGLTKAKNELCWEKERIVLEDAYRELLSK